MVRHVGVTAELVLWRVVIDTSMLCIALMPSSNRLSSAARDESGREVAICWQLATTSEVPVDEGVEVTSHQVNLEMRTQDQQISKVDSAGSAGSPCNLHG